MSALELDLRQIAFSRCETTLAIARHATQENGAAGYTPLALRSIYAGEAAPLYRLDAWRSGQPVEATLHASPVQLTLYGQRGRVEFIMPGPNVLRLRGQGLGLRMSLFSSAGQGFVFHFDDDEMDGAGYPILIPAGVDRWRSIIGASKLVYSRIVGAADIYAPWAPRRGSEHRHHRTFPIHITLGNDGAPWEFQLNSYESEIDPPPVVGDFAAAQAQVAADFATWRDASPAGPVRYQAASELAAYINWSAVAPAGGNFRAPSMLMSRNWMVNTWNWDNYINAWASVYRDPAFAWNQFLLHIEHQHPSGALGDAINEQRVGWPYTKPPIHGWVLRRMLEATDYINTERLAQVYAPLERWTEWWFRYRDDDRDGICQYHHGNDSGWDDATAFDIGAPTEAPDLTAFLVLQMEVLGDVAARLGQEDQAAAWYARSAATLDRLIVHSWRDGQFVSMVSGTHAYGGAGDSLLNYIPLILGRRLPSEILAAMIAGLTRKGRFLTEWGLASEALDSPEFLRTGYWRGAIWPPPMLIIIDGLHDAGETALAADLAERYCRLVAIHGFGENHDPISGEIHYDPAYTWAASTFQILAQRYLHDAPGRVNAKRRP